MKVKKRLLSLLLCGAMAFSLWPQAAFAVDVQNSEKATGGLCEHHPAHDASCGYTEGTAETPCAHAHGEECYTLVPKCVHAHTEDCYPAESTSDSTAAPSDATDRMPTACTHTCSEETGCITKVLDCRHEHDETCGFAPATEGTPCTYACEICNSQDGGATSGPSAQEPETGTPPAQQQEPAPLPPENHAINALTTVNNVKYIDDSGNTQTCSSATAVESGTTTWGANDSTAHWYVVNGDVTISQRITVIGDVHLILADGAKLTVNGGIGVNDNDADMNNGSNNELTIYAQSNNNKMGALIATGAAEDNTGIGTNSRSNPGGVITINGGAVEANGGYWGSGIGGGNITINSGTVTARGSDQAAGIGGCSWQAGGIITINGGVVNADGRDGGAGIGGGSMGANGKVTITGGEIHATGGNSDDGGAGIGGGERGSAGIVDISGGTVFATSRGASAGIGAGRSDGDGGTVTIRGGTVVVTGSHPCAGIGNGLRVGFDDGIDVDVTISGGMVMAGNCIDGTFSTGESGSAVIVAGEIKAETDTTGWSGLIVTKTPGEGKIYGSQTQFEVGGLEIPAGYTLAVGQGEELTVAKGTTFINRGEITNDGAITNQGTIKNFGTITGSAITNSGTIHEAAQVELKISGAYVKEDPTSGYSAAYKSEVTLTAKITDASGNPVNGGKVTFYKVDRQWQTAIGEAVVVDGVGTYSFKLDQWNPHDLASIKAEFSGHENTLSRTVELKVKITQGVRDQTPDAPILNKRSESSITLNPVTDDVGAGIQYGYVEGTTSGTPTNWKSDTTFEGLKPATAYMFYTRYAEDDYYNPSAPSEGTTIYTLPAQPQPSDVTINYAEETISFGVTLEMNTAETFDGTDITSGSSIASYIPNGGSSANLYVRIKAAGDVPASEVLAIQLSRPGAPCLGIDNRAEGVTIPAGYYYNTTSGEYNADGWTPGSDNFVTVQPRNSIYIYWAATDSAFKSGVQTLTAPDRGTAPAVPTINYGTETLSGTTTSMEYALGENVQRSWTDCTANMTLEALGWTGTEMTVRFRTKHSQRNYASDAVSLHIPARPAAPAVQGVNETVSGKKDGKITGLTAGTAYEISSNGCQSWSDATLTGTEITGLASGTYLVRVKATGSNFAGTAAEVTIASGSAPTYTLNVAAPAFDPVTYGYPQPEAKAITITSTGNSTATISGVTVDSQNFTIGGSGSTVTAGGSINTWTIQPAAGLGAGAYNATVTVTYNGGATATAQVSFTVRPASQAAPAAPELESRDRHQITLKAIAPNANGAAAEYSRDGGASWQASPVFEGLSSGTSYTFIVRYAATADGDHQASPASPAASFSTKAASSGGGGGAVPAAAAAPAAPLRQSPTAPR